jgi:hypothetical protein
MNIEPDSIILPRLYPWLEKSRLRVITFGVLAMVGLIILSYVWLTRFYSEYMVMNIYLAIILLFLLIIYFYPIWQKVGGPPLDHPAEFCPDCGSLQLGTRYCPYCGRENY